MDISIFPIPGCVTFPGSVFPLHVFEPRYRVMVRRCLENNELLAICHTRKVVSPGKPALSLAENLNSNQATYQPYDVVSAGYCELLDTTEDGRLYLNVHIQDRYRLLSEKQLLPYQIYHCERYLDRPPSTVETVKNRQLKAQILEKIQEIGAGDPIIEQLLALAEWQTKPPEVFSLELLGIVRFEPEIAQSLLELDSANQRLLRMIDLLNQVSKKST